MGRDQYNILRPGQSDGWTGWSGSCDVDSREQTVRTQENTPLPLGHPQPGVEVGDVAEDEQQVVATVHCPSWLAGTRQLTAER